MRKKREEWKRERGGGTNSCFSSSSTSSLVVRLHVVVPGKVSPLGDRVLSLSNKVYQNQVSLANTKKSNVGRKVGGRKEVGCGRKS